jgi:hypothetical protein
MLAVRGLAGMFPEALGVGAIVRPSIPRAVSITDNYPVKRENDGRQAIRPSELLISSDIIWHG